MAIWADDLPDKEKEPPPSPSSGIAWAGSSLPLFGLALALTLLLPASAGAHGFAGKRFFPTTFAVEDPFVSDEISLLVNHIKEPGEEGGPSIKSTSYGLDYAKRITPHFGLSIGQEYLHLDPDEGDDESGFANLELGAKYQFLTSEAHEALLSFGLGASIGDTGSSTVGAETFSVISPALFFGKGLGDLPESAKFFKPLAITGVVSPNLPTESNTTVAEESIANPTTLTWGLTVQYDLNYLQSYVKDIGLGKPLNRMSLVVEFPMETCMNRDCEGETTGFVNPGVVWFGKSMQLGLAAQIPINSGSGDHVGVFALLHFFLDDVYPDSLGRPLFP